MKRLAVAGLLLLIPASWLLLADTAPVGMKKSWSPARRW